MKKKDNRQIIGIVGTLLVHVAVFLLLFAIYIRRPEDLGESGVPVMLGNVDVSQGMFDPATMTEVDVLPEKVSPPETTPQEETEQDMLTQTDEETVVVKPKEEPKPKEKKIKKEETPKAEPKPKEKTEAEKRAEAEKKAAETAAKSIAGAFGKGNKMEAKGTGTTGSGIEGSSEGNSSVGKSTGVGANGTFDLNGRSLKGELPRPVKVNDEGRVVVTITVDPLGRVISTSINKRTNTVNASLRKAAEEAARKARFTTVSGVNNQMGTITYYFKWKS